MRGWDYFRVWVKGSTFTLQEELPTAVTCQGVKLGGRKFLPSTKQAGPGWVQPVVGRRPGWGCAERGRSAGQHPAPGAGL